MDAAFTEWPQRATVYGCPIGDCKWTHTEPDPTGYAVEGATIEECATNALRAHLEGVESVVKAHLETHSLLEWVTEVTRLRDQISSSAPVAEVGGFPVQIHADWPEGCRCVIAGGVRVALGDGPCPLHDAERPE